MHEIIKQLLATEVQAKHILANATTEAERLVAEAQAYTQDLLAQTRLSARREAEQIIGAAVEVAEREKEQYLARVAEEVQVRVRLDPDVLRNAIEAAVHCVRGEASVTSEILSTPPAAAVATAIRDEADINSEKVQPDSTPEFSSWPIRSG